MQPICVLASSLSALSATQAAEETPCVARLAWLHMQPICALWSACSQDCAQPNAHLPEVEDDRVLRMVPPGVVHVARHVAQVQARVVAAADQRLIRRTPKVRFRCCAPSQPAQGQHCAKGGPSLCCAPTVLALCQHSCTPSFSCVLPLLHAQCQHPAGPFHSSAIKHTSKGPGLAL